MLCTRRFVRFISTTPRTCLKKIQEKVEGNLTTVSLVDVPESPNTVYFEPENVLKAKKNLDNGGKLANKRACSFCTCKLPTKIAYTDVLILEQFMRLDGTVLPREITGLCEEQQECVERCVMQAHWSGLFPDRTIPDFDRSGYKRFNRHWYDDSDIYEVDRKMDIGTWFYIKRYNTRKALFDRSNMFNKGSPEHKKE